MRRVDELMSFFSAADAVLNCRLSIRRLAIFESRGCRGILSFAATPAGPADHTEFAEEMREWFNKAAACPDSDTSKWKRGTNTAVHLEAGASVAPRDVGNLTAVTLR